VQAFGQKLATAAEPVEKVQMANSDNFGAFKNQILTDYRRPLIAQF
jgi:hypothetical protein